MARVFLAEFFRAPVIIPGKSSHRLTPDNKTGIGLISEEMFVKSMRTGKHRGMLRDILPPMPWQSLAKASDEDLKAMFATLKSLPPALVSYLLPFQSKKPNPVRKCLRNCRIRSQYPDYLR